MAMPHLRRRRPGRGHYARRKGMTVAEAGTRLAASLAQTPEAAQVRLGEAAWGRAASVQWASRTPCAAKLSGRPGREAFRP